MLVSSHTSFRIALVGAVIFANSLFADSARLDSGDAPSGNAAQANDEAPAIETESGGAISFSASARLVNGDLISGKITRIDGDGALAIETGYAGTILIAATNVAEIILDMPVAVRAKVGDKIVEKPDAMSIESFTALWTLGILMRAIEEDAADANAANAAEPAPAPAPEAASAEPWNFSLAAEVRRADGNTDGTFTALRAEANYIEAPWTAKLFASANYDETEGAASEHKFSGGFDAGYGFNDRAGLYVRDELLTDRINDIKLRSTLAAGCELFAFKNAIPGDLEMLRLRLGLGHRYEKLRSSSESDSDMTLDTGAKFRKRLSDAAIWDTELTWVPAFDEFGDYILTHETRLEINLSARWKLTQDFGVRHEYNSQPASGTDKLDSTYFARVRKTW